jgi:glycosyltransferase involved in cell wall biosynthesis
MRNYLDLPAVLRLRRLLKTSGAELVHANTGRDTWLGGCAAHLAGLPAVTTRRMEGRVKRGLRSRLIYRRFFQRVGAISPGVRDCLREGGVPEDRIALIPEACDPDRIATRAGREATRAALEVSDDAVLVLGLGALIRRKGFDVLLDALAALEPIRLQAVQVRIAGDGPERDALATQARDHGLEGRVRLLGHREDVGDLLAACDVFVLPSRSEGLGVASLEAMGAGRPAIVSRVGGLGFAVRDLETGLLVPPGDATALAAALDRLVGDAALRERLGDGGRARVRERFDPEGMVSAYASLYEGVLRERRGAGAVSP